jgi:hypothetical protein
MEAMYSDWAKSSYSGGAGEDCVERRLHLQAPLIDVRDSKKGDQSAILTFPAGAWSAFIGDIKG